MALEKEWGIKLFSRKHRKVTLTQEALNVLPDVREILDKEQQLKISRD